MAIQQSTLRFLSDLNENNNREWFLENKERYQQALDNVKELAADFYEIWSGVEAIPPQDPAKSLFRIYRDVRFSKNKEPYKAWLSFETKRMPGHMGIYIHIQPSNKSFAATGLWEPSPQQLALARQEIDYNSAALKKILNTKKLKDIWGEMQGAQLKTAPKGYAKDDPNVDLLRFKQFMLVKNFKDSEVKSADFVGKLKAAFVEARAFMEFFDAAVREGG